MASLLIGKYKLLSSEGVDQYLQGLDVGLVFRKVQQAARPMVGISYDPSSQEWTYRNMSVFNQHELVFKLGKSVKDETFDARECKTLTQLVNGKLQMEQICETGPNVILTIEKNSDGLLKISHTCGKYSCSQYFTETSKKTSTQKSGPGDMGFDRESGLHSTILEEFKKLEMGVAEGNGNSEETGNDGGWETGTETVTED